MRFSSFAVFAILAITVESITAAAPPKEVEDAKKEETKRLEAKWTVASNKLNGVDVEGGAILIAEFDFVGTKWVIRSKPGGKTEDASGEFELDPKAKPKAIDLLSRNEKDKCWPGIYEIDGDELRLCFPTDESARPFKRPDSFDTKGKDTILFVMRRAKQP